MIFDKRIAIPLCITLSIVIIFGPLYLVYGVSYKLKYFAADENGRLFVGYHNAINVYDDSGFLYDIRIKNMAVRFTIINGDTIYIKGPDKTYKMSVNDREYSETTLDETTEAKISDSYRMMDVIPGGDGNNRFIDVNGKKYCREDTILREKIVRYDKNGRTVLYEISVLYLILKIVLVIAFASGLIICVAANVLQIKIFIKQEQKRKYENGHRPD